LDDLANTDGEREWASAVVAGVKLGSRALERTSVVHRQTVALLWVRLAVALSYDARLVTKSNKFTLFGQSAASLQLKGAQEKCINPITHALTGAVVLTVTPMIAGNSQKVFWWMDASKGVVKVGLRVCDCWLAGRGVGGWWLATC
jgi:hypothetical protein